MADNAQQAPWEIDWSKQTGGKNPWDVDWSATAAAPAAKPQLKTKLSGATFSSPITKQPRTPLEQKVVQEFEGTPKPDQVLASPIMGGVAAPAAEFGGVMAGYGAEKLGEHLKLPPWATAAASLIAGAAGAAGLGGTAAVINQLKKLKGVPPEMRSQIVRKAGEELPYGAGKIFKAYNKLASFFEPKAEEPFKPGAATKRNMPEYGGPAKVESQAKPGPVKRLVGRPAAEIGPKPTEPGKGTATKYGGPNVEESQAQPGRVKRLFGKPAAKLGQLSPEGPAPETKPLAPKPFKPSAGVKRTLRFGGPAEPGYGKAGGRLVRRGINRAMMPEPAEGAGEGVEEAPEPQQPKAPKKGPDEPVTQHTADPRSIGMENVAHKARVKTDTIAKRLLEQGIDPDEVDRYSDAEINKVARDTISPITGKAYEPFRGKGQELHRSPTAAKADIVRTMREMQKRANPRN